MTTAKEFFLGIKQHPFEALFTAGLASVLLALPVVAFAGQDPPEQPPSLEEGDGSARSVEEVLDPELDTPTVEPPASPEEDATPHAATPEANVDEQTPEVTIEGEPEAEDPACCEPGEPQEITSQSERDVGGNSAVLVRTSRKSRASIRKDAGTSKLSGGATRLSAGAEKSSGTATTQSAETTTNSAQSRSTRSSGKSSDHSPSTKKALSGSTSVSQVSDTRVAPAPGRPYAVRRGDCLWLITRAALGNRVSIVRINSGWQRIWRANTSTIGGNPHLIFPGQVLRIPREM